MLRHRREHAICQPLRGGPRLDAQAPGVPPRSHRLCTASCRISLLMDQLPLTGGAVARSPGVRCAVLGRRPGGGINRPGSAGWFHDGCDCSHRQASSQRRVWVVLPAASALPAHLVHGDVTADNVGVADGVPTFLDFGFVAWRPRIHDLAFTLVYEVFQARDGRRLEPEDIAWARLPNLLAEYERTAPALTLAERAALAPYAAALLLYFPATGYFVPDAAAWIASQRPGLRLATWLLDNQSELCG